MKIKIPIEVADDWPVFVAIAVIAICALALVWIGGQE